MRVGSHREAIRVRSVMSSKRTLRVLVLAIPCLAPMLSGCNDDYYPEELTYPLRSDPIVVKPPITKPWETSGPGQLDAHIATFDPQTILDPKTLDDKSRQELDTILNKLFGTPAAPIVNPADEDEESQKAKEQQIQELKLDKESLKEGSKYYRRHCMHCHGVPGDGRGPTAPWISPHPRDYRQGTFKFISSSSAIGGNRKPSRDDIRRTLEHGIEGTSMPSFKQLGERDVDLLIGYVIHLSLRGEAEMSTMRKILNKDALEGDSISGNVQSVLSDSLKLWARSSKEILEPTPYPYNDEDKEALNASIRRGYEKFTNPSGAASCIACHLDFGRQVPFQYDDWGTLVRPANLAAGIYRGGRRPIDLYWRIRGGIPGSQMPKVDFEQSEFTTKDGKKVDPYWDMVNFVRALPYPEMLPNDRPDDVRARIYHTPTEKKESKHAAR